MREREGQSAGPRRIEQESSRDILIDAAAGRGIVHIEIPSGDEVGRRIKRQRMTSLVEGRDLIQNPHCSTKHRSVQWVDGPIILTVHTDGRIELGLFNRNVGQAAFLRVAADGDVQVVLQCANRRVRQRDGFTPLLRDRLSDVQAPAIAWR